MKVFYYCLLYLCACLSSFHIPACEKMNSDMEHYPERTIGKNEAFNKIVKEFNLNSSDFTIRYESPFYIIEPVIKEGWIGGGRTFKINAVTGDVVEEIFTE